MLVAVLTAPIVRATRRSSPARLLAVCGLSWLVTWGVFALPLFLGGGAEVPPNSSLEVALPAVLSIGRKTVCVEGLEEEDREVTLPADGGGAGAAILATAQPVFLAFTREEDGIAAAAQPVELFSDSTSPRKGRRRSLSCGRRRR